MTQKEIDHIRKRERWREIIARQKESGLSIAAFCRNEGISARVFSYWKTIIVRETLSDASMLGVLNAPPLVDGARETVDAVREIAFQPEDIVLPTKKLPCDAEQLCRIVENLIEEGWVIRNYLVTTFHMASKTGTGVMWWLEHKGIIKRESAHRPGFVRITRDQWESMKEALLTTDKTVADLLGEEPAAQAPVPAKETAPAGNTYIEKLDKLFPQPTAKEKKNDGGGVPAIVSSGVMYDVKKKHLYVSGDVKDEAIDAIARLLKELGY